MVQVLGGEGPENDMSLLDLPVDLLHSVFDFLQLYEKVIIIQTCRSLRCVFQTRGHSAMRNAPINERLDCLVKLKQHLHGFRVCYSCHGLHGEKIVSESTPRISGIYFSSPPCPKLNPNWRSDPMLGACPIPFQHVRKAVEYLKLPRAQQKYRSELSPEIHIRSDDFCSLKLRYYTRSEVTRTGKYLLRTVWEFRKPKLFPLSVESFRAANLRICPHIALMPGLRGPLHPYIRELFKDHGPCRGIPDAAEGGSCRWCPTDFVICALDYGTKAVITVYQDLGSGQHRDDPCWTSHMEAGDNEVSRGVSSDLLGGHSYSMWRHYAG